MGVGASVGEEGDDSLSMCDQGLCDTLKILDAAVLCSLDLIYQCSLGFLQIFQFVDVFKIHVKVVGLFNTWVELEKQECTVYLRLRPLMRHLVENVPRSCEELLGCLSIGQDDGFVLGALLLTLDDGLRLTVNFFPTLINTCLLDGIRAQLLDVKTVCHLGSHGKRPLCRLYHTHGHIQCHFLD